MSLEETGMGRRWFAEERVGPREYRRHPDQPWQGFANVGEVMDWLLEQGCIERVEPPDDEPWVRGWGDPWHAKAADS